MVRERESSVNKKYRRALTRAKILTAEQFNRAMREARREEHSVRAEVLLRLSFFCGLRAKEMASIRWVNNLLGPTGEINDTLHITRDAGKRAVERRVPMPIELRKALRRLRDLRPDDEYVIYRLDGHFGKCEPNTLVQWFKRFYARVGFVGVSSHSGRRTFITNTARNANLVGASIKDVQILAGHKRLETTAGYIEPSDTQKVLAETVFG
jgi:integrase/recombinase XerD